MIANVLMSYTVRSENFQKIISEQQLACPWTCSMNVKLGTFETSLAR